VLGFSPSTGQLHLHIVIVGGPYVPQRLLSQQAREVGLGQTYVGLIGSSDRDIRCISNYLGRNLLALRDAPKVDGQRLRPFNPSRSWPGGTLTKPAWRREVEVRRFILVGLTAGGVPWARTLNGEEEVSELLKAA
jgi:hypothetical protein